MLLCCDFLSSSILNRKNNMKKVIYFDSWAQGVPYVKNVDEVLSSKGIDTKFIHIESMIYKTIPAEIKKLVLCNKQEIREGISCFDISYYGKHIVDAFIAEKPDLVVMISLTHMENRIVTRYCQQNNIPIVYMMHGNLRTDRNEVEALILNQAKKS